MINAKKEILNEIGSREIDLIRIVFGCPYGRQPQKTIEGGIEVIDKLDFEYDNGFGGQELFGYIWYKDGTWSERGEYDGSEWWEHKERPVLDISIGV